MPCVFVSHKWEGKVINSKLLPPFVPLGGDASHIFSTWGVLINCKHLRKPLNKTQFLWIITKWQCQLRFTMFTPYEIRYGPIFVLPPITGSRTLTTHITDPWKPKPHPKLQPLVPSTFRLDAYHLNDLSAMTSSHTTFYCEFFALVKIHHPKRKV